TRQGALAGRGTAVVGRRATSAGTAPRGQGLVIGAGAVGHKCVDARHPTTAAGAWSGSHRAGLSHLSASLRVGPERCYLGAQIESPRPAQQWKAASGRARGNPTGV